MKKSLWDYGEQKLNKDVQKNQVREEDVIREYDKIKNMSQNEAQNNLMAEVLNQKQNGTFDFQKLASQVESLKGYLPEKDFENLKGMLESLKWILIK